MIKMINLLTPSINLFQNAGEKNKTIQVGGKYRNIRKYELIFNVIKIIIMRDVDDENKSRMIEST